MRVNRGLETSWMGLAPFCESRESLLPITAPHPMRRQWEVSSLHPRRRPSPQNPTNLAPRSQTSRLRNCEKQASIVYKPPRLCNFVMMVWTKTGIFQNVLRALTGKADIIIEVWLNRYQHPRWFTVLLWFPERRKKKCPKLADWHKWCIMRDPFDCLR